ncbi:MAG: ORF6N domain-containing protein [Steroidobacteraceae bacterium]
MAGVSPAQKILAATESRICTIRGLAVLLDADLAELYGVSVSALLQAVRRNRERFPGDFVFIVTNHELTNLKSQSVISSLGRTHGGRRSLPHAFTEQGVAMLSSVLRSPVAVQVNIEIMRAFVRVRRAALMSQELMKLIEDLATRVNAHDEVISDLVESIRQLVECPPESRTRPIGFTADWEK